MAVSFDSSGSHCRGKAIETSLAEFGDSKWSIAGLAPCSLKRNVGPCGEIAGITAAGILDQWSGVLDQQSGILDQRSGILDQRSGFSDQRSGISDQRSGVSDQRSGVSDQRSGARTVTRGTACTPSSTCTACTRRHVSPCRRPYDIS